MERRPVNKEQLGVVGCQIRRFSIRAVLLLIVDRECNFARLHPVHRRGCGPVDIVLRGDRCVQALDFDLVRC